MSNERTITAKFESNRLSGELESSVYELLYPQYKVSTGQPTESINKHQSKPPIKEAKS